LCALIFFKQKNEKNGVYGIAEATGIDVHNNLRHSLRRGDCNFFFPLISNTIEILGLIYLCLSVNSQSVISTGDAEKFLWRRREELVNAVASILKQRKLKNVQELIALHQTPGACESH
jgi:predicted RNA-binding protein with PUA-like domain